MANIMVAGDLYESITGQLFEIGRQLRQLNGYPFDASRLKTHLQAAIEGRFTAVTGTFKYDRRKDGWTLLENAPHRISSVIDAVKFLKNGEDSVKGDVMAARAVELDANYGQEDAELLLEHQDMIPEELRKFYLVFPATIWRDSGGRRYVPCMDWLGDRWGLFFHWLDRGFGGYARLVRPRK